jgi:hypothetical protein
VVGQEGSLFRTVPFKRAELCAWCPADVAALHLDAVPQLNLGLQHWKPRLQPSLRLLETEPVCKEAVLVL